MGGYGAMNIALANPTASASRELARLLQRPGPAAAPSAPAIARLGLHAFLYGGASDRIANAGENAPFAAALRAAGADAHSAVYPGDHSMQTLEAHLGSMLGFAGRAFAGAMQAG